MIVVVMGVAGSGKSTVGELLGARLGWTYYEGDAFHSAANIEKMTNGIPLTDADRWPWLASIREEIRRCSEKGTNAVVACSALRGAYRSYLAENVPGVRFVHLHGDPALILERLRSRASHYMGEAMLESQLVSLETPEDAIRVDIVGSPEEIVDRIRAELELRSA